MFSEKIKKNIEGGLLGKIGLLGFGVALGQIITLAISPLLTRLYDAEDLGLFGAFSSLSFLIGGVATLRYDIGIVLAKRKSQAASLFVLSIINTLLVSFISLLVVASAATLLGGELLPSDSQKYLIWLPFQVISIGLFMCGSQWATRNNEYKPQAVYQISRAISVAALHIIFGYLLFGASGLIAGQVIGFIFATFVLINKSILKDLNIFKRNSSRRRIFSQSRRFKNLPKFVVAQDIATSLSQALPYFFIGHFFGMASVGYYWLAVRAMQMPINFVSQSIRQVFLKHISSLVSSRKKIFYPAFRATLALLFLSTIAFSPVIIYGPEIFGLIFGDEWASSGVFARWIGLWMLTALVKVPSWCIFHTTNMQRTQFRFEISSFLFQIILLITSCMFFDEVIAVATFCMVSALFNAITIFTSLRIAKTRDNTNEDCIYTK